MKKEKLKILINKNNQNEIEYFRNVFSDFDLKVDVFITKSIDVNNILNITIEIGKWVLSSTAWDLLKLSFTKIFKKDSSNRISVNINDNIFIYIDKDWNIKIPSLITMNNQELKDKLSKIKNINDLQDFLKDFYYEQDLDKWHKIKLELNKNKREIIFKDSEIWWCSFGKNIGEEIYGKGEDYRRPAIILKKLSKNTAVVVPTTSKEHKGSWYFEFEIKGEKRWAMINQIRFISANRMSIKKGQLNKSQFLEIKKSLAGLLGFDFISSPELDSGSSGHPKYVNSIANSNKKVK